jgi:hypothetical protein
VERTLAWITRHRRTVRGYERLPARHETYIYWAMIIVMTRRLARAAAHLVPRHPTFALSPTGTCVARSTRVEEDGFAGGRSVGCAGGPLP